MLSVIVKSVSHIFDPYKYVSNKWIPAITGPVVEMRNGIRQARLTIRASKEFAVDVVDNLPRVLLQIVHDYCGSSVTEKLCFRCNHEGKKWVYLCHNHLLRWVRM
jgi:hypothetical protein